MIRLIITPGKDPVGAQINVPDELWRQMMDYLQFTDFDAEPFSYPNSPCELGEGEILALQVLSAYEQTLGAVPLSIEELADMMRFDEEVVDSILAALVMYGYLEFAHRSHDGWTGDRWRAHVEETGWLALDVGSRPTRCARCKKKERERFGPARQQYTARLSQLGARAR